MSDGDRLKKLSTAVRENTPRLLAVAGRRLRDRFESEDVVQDAFVELLEVDNVGSAIDRLGAWLVRVAQNKVLDRFRRRATRAEYEASELASGELREAAPAHEEPDASFARTLLRREIAAAIAQLPPEQRDVFVKHELEGLSFEEIAAETGIKVNTLLSRKRAAVQFLRDFLKEAYDEL